MPVSNRCYMPHVIRKAYEHAADKTHRHVVDVQELAIRNFLQSNNINYDFQVVRKKRGPKPKRRSKAA